MFGYGFEELQISGLQPSLLVNKIKLAPKTLSLLFLKIRLLPNGCWQWIAAKQKGYGAVRIRAISSGVLRVHRVCYELVNGPIGVGMDLHHKVEEGCIGPSCCNPSHLLEIDHGEHTRDVTPNSLTYKYAHQISCMAGHPYTIESLRLLNDGKRQCRICDKIKAQEKRDRLRVRPKFAKDPAKLKTHCLRGHSLMDENNIRLVDSPWGKQKYCIQCGVDRRLEARERFKRIAAGEESPRKPSPLQKDICKNGHPMEGDNIYINPSGYGRGCRACRLAGVKKHQAENREEHLKRRKELRLNNKEAAAHAAHARILAIYAEPLADDELIVHLRAALPPAEK